MTNGTNLDQEHMKRLDRTHALMASFATSLVEHGVCDPIGLFGAMSTVLIDVGDALPGEEMGFPEADVDGLRLEVGAGILLRLAGGNRDAAMAALLAVPEEHVVCAAAASAEQRAMVRAAYAANDGRDVDLSTLDEPGSAT